MELRLVLVTPDLVLARLATPGDTPDQGPDRPRPDPDPTVAEVIGSLNLLCPFSFRYNLIRVFLQPFFLHHHIYICYFDDENLFKLP